MIKISVITICRNEEKNIENTIKSVIQQTVFNQVEYIIIDGGSTDATVDLIKGYRDKLAYFISEPDTGIYNALNKGIKVATGEFLIFCNAGDSIINELVFEELIDILSTTKHDLVIGNLFAFNK
jgi:glycosyltransferase involved in cell wall biosynthesis